MKLLNLKSFIFTGLLLICGMAFAGEPKVYTQYDHNIDVDVQNHDFIIKLNSNPSTGYAWDKPSFAGDTTLLTYEYSFEPSKGQGERLGVSAHDLWIFHVNDSAFLKNRVAQIHFVKKAPSGELAQQVDFVLTIHSVTDY